MYKLVLNYGQMFNDIISTSCYIYFTIIHREILYLKLQLSDSLLTNVDSQYKFLILVIIDELPVSYLKKLFEVILVVM